MRTAIARRMPNLPPGLSPRRVTAALLLGLLVCLVQTAVFTILSCVYIALHTEEPSHGHAEAH